MARRYYSSTAARTTLASGVDDSTTTLSVVAVSGWPASYPYTLILDQDTVNEEIVEVSARSGTTLTVTRGVDGTSATAHDAGAAVNHGVSARDFDEPNEFINGTGVVTETMLASDSVTSAKIVDGTIVNADINASAAIAQSKVADLTSDLASKLDLAGGKILQIVRATDTTERSTTTTGFVDASISVTITPQKSDSAIVLVWSFWAQNTSSLTGNFGSRADFVLTDASDNFIDGSRGRFFFDDINVTAAPLMELYFTLVGYSTPATTSATTYKGRFEVGTATTTATIRNNQTTGQLYAIEVSA